MTGTTTLAAAVERLKAFRAALAEGQVGDGGSGLTTEDLTAIIDHCDRPKQDLVADALGDLA